jgi:hypothetical protein
MSIHQVYETLKEDEANAVDQAWYQVARAFEEWGLKAATDDRAERLVEAIAVYLKESNQ